MKAFLTALLAMTLFSTAALDKAMAKDVQLPSDVNETEAFLDYLAEFRSVQLAELSVLEVQQKYFEIMRSSFEGSHALSTAFDSEAVQSTADLAKGGVQIVMDAYLAKMWLAGATPSAMVIKDIWAASLDNTSRMSAMGKKTFESLKALGRSMKVPKNVVSTVALGAFAYIQYENIWVINMSQAQYEATIAALDAKIADVKLRQAQIADGYVPLSAR